MIIQVDLRNYVTIVICGFADENENLKLTYFSLKRIVFSKVRILHNKDFSATVV